MHNKVWGRFSRTRLHPQTLCSLHSRNILHDMRPPVLAMVRTWRLTRVSPPAAGGRAIYASGSPQEDVVMNGKKIASSQVRVLFAAA